jgi:hypothetical protein
MYKNRIDMTIAAEKLTTLNTLLTSLETECEILIPLDPVEAKRLAKMGLRNETFVRGVLDAAASNPALIPPTVDRAALERDKVAREQLLPIQQRVQRLHDLLASTNALLGADMYSGALAIYKTFKTFGPGAGLSMLLEDLGRRFARSKKATSPTTTPA